MGGIQLPPFHSFHSLCTKRILSIFPSRFYANKKGLKVVRIASNSLQSLNEFFRKEQIFFTVSVLYNIDLAYIPFTS
jgi:hypothetical protein